ncbi:hypothetical protein ACWCPI_09190 [Streptomyces sp. NPDC001920]
MSMSYSRGDQWTFLTSHARVLLQMARDADTRLRHPAEAGHPVGDLLGAFLHREESPDPTGPESSPT